MQFRIFPLEKEQNQQRVDDVIIHGHHGEPNEHCSDFPIQSADRVQAVA